MRAALYLRVSTDDQTTENQERELRAAAARIGHEVVAVYRDEGFSGSNGRDRRPGFDAMHRDAARRKFDVVMAWSVDRLGRSLQDAASIAGLLITTEAMVAELPKKQSPAMPGGPGGGMGGLDF